MFSELEKILHKLQTYLKFSNSFNTFSENANKFWELHSPKQFLFYHKNATFVLIITETFNIS